MLVWLLLSKPIFWNPETHFRGRIFELEKWVFESTRFDFSSIDLFYNAAWQICHDKNWKYVFCGISIHFRGRVCDFWFWDRREEGGMVNISEVLHRMYPISKTICVSRVSYSYYEWWNVLFIWCWLFEIDSAIPESGFREQDYRSIKISRLVQ
jgi:hypothetical protein